MRQRVSSVPLVYKSVPRTPPTNHVEKLGCCVTAAYGSLMLTSPEYFFRARGMGRLRLTRGSRASCIYAFASLLDIIYTTIVHAEIRKPWAFTCSRAHVGSRKLLLFHVHSSLFEFTLNKNRISRRMHGIFGEWEQAHNSHLSLITTCTLEPRRYWKKRYSLGQASKSAAELTRVLSLATSRIRG